MPIAWRRMSFRQQVNATLDNVDGLTEEDKLQIQAEWAEARPLGGAYPDSFAGRIESLSDLQGRAVRYLLEKQGRLSELTRYKNDYPDR